MLLQQSKPAHAYRRIDVEARVLTADQQELVRMCLDRVSNEIASALRAHEGGDRTRRGAGLTGAYAALTALEMGVDRTAQLAEPLLDLYGAARQTILKCVTDFDVAALSHVRDDFREISSSLAPAGAPQ